MAKEQPAKGLDESGSADQSGSAPPRQGIRAGSGDGQHAAVGAGTAATQISPALSPFPPIAEYAFLSDCEVNALVSPAGRVEWLCLPRPDGRSVFGAILDRAAGSFRLGPTGFTVPAGRRYLPGTLVLETTWRTHTGWLLVRDALCIGPWYHQQRRSGTHRRPPTDHEAEHRLRRHGSAGVGIGRSRGGHGRAPNRGRYGRSAVGAGSRRTPRAGRAPHHHRPPTRR